MIKKERQKLLAWVDHFRDPVKVKKEMVEAGLDCTNIDEVIHFFEVPLRISIFLAGPDPHSGVADMQAWLAKLEHKMKFTPSASSDQHIGNLNRIGYSY